MSDPNQIVTQKSEYWIRVGLAINHTIKDILVSILHNTFKNHSYIGLPTDPQQLYTALDGIRKSNIIPNQVLGKKQWAIILPPPVANAAGCSYSKDFDITIIIVLIRHGTNIKPPCGGWASGIPEPSDTSEAACCIFAQQLRNDFSHNKLPIIMSLGQFQSTYQRIERITFGMCSFDNLKYKQYKDQLDEFKNGSLHPHLMVILDSVQQNFLKDFDKINLALKFVIGEIEIMRDNSSFSDERLKELDEKTSEMLKDTNEKLQTLGSINDETNWKLKDTNDKLQTLESRMFCFEGKGHLQDLKWTYIQEHESYKNLPIDARKLVRSENVRWSVICCFKNLFQTNMNVKEILILLEEEILKKENISYYENMLENENHKLFYLLQTFSSTGNSNVVEFYDIILNALADLFKVTIVLVTDNDDKGYVLAEEKNYIIPRMKTSLQTICMTFDGKLFHALLEKDARQGI